ncbi:MAG: hypothetical protein KAU17_12875 [Spirochaetales bacterium]|nr:hypothetical protein [Spirochaetales bacterium]
MGKISADAKKYYFDRIKEYKITIDQIHKREKNILQVIKTDEKGASYKKATLADESMNLVSYYILMNSLSLSLLGVKNDAFLNDARKACYKAIIYLEDVVSSYIDVPFSDYEEKLATLEALTDEARFALISKLGFSIQSVVEGFGENSKWKWSFVEIEGRFATVCKNIMDLRNLLAGMDPRSPGYEARLRHLQLTKKLLQQSADRYREKYELSTLRIDDFKLAISYLAALRRIEILIGEAADAEIIKKKMDIWRTKMEADSKKKEQVAKDARVKRKK